MARFELRLWGTCSPWPTTRRLTARVIIIVVVVLATQNLGVPAGPLSAAVAVLVGVMLASSQLGKLLLPTTPATDQSGR